MTTGMRSTHLSRYPHRMPTLKQRTEPIGHVAAQLNVTVCGMSCSWLTCADPPLRATMWSDGDPSWMCAELADLGGGRRPTAFSLARSFDDVDSA